MVTESRINLIVNASNAIRPLQRTNDITRKLAGNNRRLQGRIDRTNKSLRATGAAAAVASGGLNAVAGAARNLLLGFGLFKTAEFILFNRSIALLNEDFLNKSSACCFVFIISVLLNLFII